MRVLQFAKRPALTLVLVCVTLAGCGGESISDAPFNPAGTSADLQAMNSTFASPTFASFSTFSLLFDQALGGSAIISGSAAALDIRGKDSKLGTTAAVRAAALRSAQRLAAIMPKRAADGFSASMAPLPAEVAGKTFVYDVGTDSYVASDLPLLANNKVRFILYAVDPVTFTPIEPLVETGYVDLTDLSAGSTQAARVQVVSGSTTYLDYTVSASSTTTSGRISIIGYVTDGVIQANVNLRATLTFTAGLTLTYSLDLPQRDVSIDLTVNVSDTTNPNSPVEIDLLMRGPNGSVAINGQFVETTGTFQVRISGDAFATITTNGGTTTMTRTDGSPLSEEELVALNAIFDLQAEAFLSFDQMFAPVGAMLSE